MAVDSVAQLDSVSESMEAELPQNLQLVSEFLGAWIAAKKEFEQKSKNEGVGFNPLSLIPIKENTHSRILGDLLNPKGSHGQGPLFLNVFLGHLKVLNPEQGEWQVSVEEGRVDVMLRRHDPASVILIENKAKGAADQQNQLYRYWHENIHMWKPELDYQLDEVRANYRLVYMPADGSRGPDAHSLMRPDYLRASNHHEILPLNYQLLSFVDFSRRLIRPTLCDSRIPKNNQRLRVFLELYIEHWSS